MMLREICASSLFTSMVMITKTLLNSAGTFCYNIKSQTRNLLLNINKWKLEYSPFLRKWQVIRILKDFNYL